MEISAPCRFDRGNQEPRNQERIQITVVWTNQHRSNERGWNSLFASFDLIGYCCWSCLGYHTVYIISHSMLVCAGLLAIWEKSLRHVAMVAKFLDSTNRVPANFGRKKNTWHVRLSCMIALRNKRVALTFLPLFDNSNCRLCQERLLWSAEILLPWQRDVTFLFQCFLVRL